MRGKIPMRISLSFSILFCAVYVLGMGRSPQLNGSLVTGSVILNAKTGEKTKIRYNDEREGYVSFSQLSPNGKQVVFTYRLGNVANPGGVELRTVELDSGNEKIWLTSDSGFHYSWSPDSKFLLVSDWFLAPYDLFINLSSGNAWAVKVPPEIIGPSFDSWSRDGMHLYYSRRNDHYDGVEMVKLKLDFTDIQHLVDIPDGMEIIISPNEKLVAYTKSATPGIFTLNVDTNLERRIMKTNKITDSIFWSPDNQWTGTKLSTNFQGSDKYFAYNINTGKRKTLPIYYYTSGVQWWAPQTESPPDCEKIVNETLGPGKKLDDLLQDLQKEEK